MARRTFHSVPIPPGRLMPSAARWVRALDTRRLGSYLYLGVCDRRPPRPVEGSLFEDACFRLLGFPKAVCPDNPFIRGARLDGSGVASMAGGGINPSAGTANTFVVVVFLGGRHGGPGDLEAPVF